MSAQAMGPTYAGGTQPIVKDGYATLYLPDVQNRALIAQGDSPVFYSVPNQVRMARKGGPDKGDFLFNLVRFAGVGGDGVVGGGGDVAGGVVTFSVTGAIPESTRTQSEQAIVEQFADSDDPFWGIRGARKAPTFRPAIVATSTAAVSNVSPTAKGFPAIRSDSRRRGTRSAFYGAPSARKGAAQPRIVRDGIPADAGTTTQGSDNLAPWYWDMQGEGAGSIDPAGTHAFSALIGEYPANILWSAFHGTASPLIVIQNYKLKVWSPVVRITIHGEWDRIFTHFSAAASGRYLWAKVDLQAEFNKMKTDGTITTDVKVDTTLPGAEAIAKRLEDKSDLVFNKFMEQAQKMIFDPPQPQVEAAKADSGGWGLWGAGVALKYRRDETNLVLDYEETQQFAYLQDHTVSNSLAGMYDEIKADVDAEHKYFITVNLDDWPRKLNRVVRPVAAWADGAVQFMSAQIGYPATDGSIVWQGHVFSGDEGNDGTYKWSAVQKDQAEVAGAPSGWSPDQTFVKRKVHLAEVTSETGNPFRRVQMQKNIIDIDPEPNGTLLNDTIVEVRADAAGQLAVGPIQLGAILTDESQTVEAIFQATDEDGAPTDIPPVRFQWNQNDIASDRVWNIFTGDPAFKPYYRYMVIVTVKGTIFEPGRSWEGPWITTQGNGPLVISVPRPGDNGVTMRSRSILDSRVAKLRSLPSVKSDMQKGSPGPNGVHLDRPVGARARVSGSARFLNYDV